MRSVAINKVMANKRSRTANRKETGSFLVVPHELLLSDAYISLSSKAVKCLFDMYVEYKGNNNGDLSCTIKVMKKRGWKSKSQLDKARKELIAKGLIVLTRQGGRNKCSLYAVTWKPIDECKGKLDRKADLVPLGYWKLGYNPELQSIDEKLIPVPRIEGQRTPNRGAVIPVNSTLPRIQG